MTPTEAINTLYYDDMDILHIDNWRFFTPKKRDRDDTPLRQKQYHAPMNIERWALPLIKSAELVPKSSKTIARSQIKCASCEICFYHLGLKSPDLSPPLKTCTSVTSATVPTTGNACLKQAAATPLKGKLLMPMIHGPALPVSI
jgi:hypothetical protein